MKAIVTDYLLRTLVDFDKPEGFEIHGKSFLKLGDCDVSAIKKQVLEITEEEWSQDSYRQKTYRVHSQTTTVPLLFDDDFRHTSPTRYDAYDRFASNLQPVLDQIRQRLNVPGAFVRILFARLPPGSKVRAHRDRGYSLCRSHRLHVPIVTNPETLFTVAPETRNLLEGEIWEINNTRAHAVVNGGSTFRVHLLVDYAPALNLLEQVRYYASQKTVALLGTRGGKALQLD